MFKKLTASIFCFFTFQIAQAETAKNLLHGIWSGKIGNLPINACFDIGQESYQFGAYYYLSQLKLIPMRFDDKTAIWAEDSDKNAPQWKIDISKPNDISGEWSGGNKHLPIKLSRMPGKTIDSEGSDHPCGSNAFFTPRITPYKIIEKPAVLDGISYTKILVDAGKQFDVSLGTFKLKGTSPQIKAVNSALQSILPKKGKPPEFLECIQFAAGANGRDGNYSVSASPIILTKNWMVVSSGDGSYCGGAHPENSSSETIYDLRKGTAIDLRKWFRTEGLDKNGNLTKKLKALVQQKYVAELAENKECAESAKGAYSWWPSLTKFGLSFTPSLSYAETACMNPTIFNFEDVKPFLNTEGKIKLEDFRSEVSN